jgi:hypothetical protein
MEEKLYRQKSFFGDKKNIYSKINNNSDVCHIYYDILVSNNNTSQPSNQGIIPCSFSQSRENPYLDTPEDYIVTVPYLKIDSNNFPLQLINPIRLSNTINNKIITQYVIYINGILPSGDWNAINIDWTPPDATIYAKYNGLPTNSVPLNDPYFFNYSYNYLLNIINNAIYTFFNNNSLSYITPYLTFNPVNKKFSIIASQLFDDKLGSYYIGMSEELYSLFDGFSASLVPFNTYPVFIYKINIVRTPLNLVPNYTSLSSVPLVATDYWIKTEQNFPSISIWNPVVSLVFVARYLNVIRTLEARPFIYGYDPNPPNANNASVSSVLLEIPISSSANPSIYYEPSAEFVLTNLMGLVESYDLQIDVFWKDSYGNLNIFYLDIGSSLNLKLLFRKKAFNY